MLTNLQTNLESVFPILREETFYCSICLEDKKLHDQIVLPLCQHIFCRTCVQSQLEIQINQNQIPVTCWQIQEGKEVLLCKAEISKEFIESNQLVPNLVLKNYELRMKLQNPFMGQCHICKSLILQENKDSNGKPLPDLKCSTCQTNFCLIHSGLHKDESCSSYLDRVKETTENAKILKRTTQSCPNCNALISRNGGCNKMVCSQCKSVFCWKCRTILASALNYDHFGTSQCPLFGNQKKKQM